MWDRFEHPYTVMMACKAVDEIADAVLDHLARQPEADLRAFIRYSQADRGKQMGRMDKKELCQFLLVHVCEIYTSGFVFFRSQWGKDPLYDFCEETAQRYRIQRRVANGNERSEA